MSLLQSITEIESVLSGLSLTRHPDLQDKSLVDSGGEIDGHFLVLPGADVIPWIDADAESDLWSVNIQIEISTLEKTSQGVAVARITAEGRARQAIQNLLYNNLSYGQLWEETTEVINSDRYIIWRMNARLRYTGATV